MSAPVGTLPPKHKLCPTCRRIYPAAHNYCPQDQTALIVSEDVIAGRYIIIRMIGAGAMGKVYRAEDTVLGRQVALKLLNPAKDAHVRIDREAKAVGALDHDNVVRVYERNQHDDGRLFIAMEYLEGESLRQHLATHGKLAMKPAMELWLQAVRGVAAAHKKGVVHRDLKPDNLFLARREQDDGTIEQLKVLDFGIAQMMHADRPTATRGTVRIGTPGYVAPEQWMHGEATARSDVYSLGVILLEMLTGRRTMAANPLAPVEAFERYALQERLSGELAQLAKDVLAPDPLLRPENARVLLDRLRALPESQGWSSASVVVPRETPAVAAQSSDDGGQRIRRRSEPILPLPALAPLSDEEEAEDTEQVAIASLHLPTPQLPAADGNPRLQAMNQATVRVDRLPGLVPTPAAERPTASLPEKFRGAAVERPATAVAEAVTVKPVAEGLAAPPEPVPEPALDIGADLEEDPGEADLGEAGPDEVTRTTKPPLELSNSGQNTLVLTKPADLLKLSLGAPPDLPPLEPLEQVETRISASEPAKQSPGRRPAKDAATMMSRRPLAATLTSGVSVTIPSGVNSADLWPRRPSFAERLLAFLRSPTALGPVSRLLMLCALLGILVSLLFIWLRSPS